MALAAQRAQDEAPGVGLGRPPYGLVSVSLHELVVIELLAEHFIVRVISEIGLYKNP